MATQKEQFQLDKAKKEAFKKYLLLCEQLIEVPRMDIILLIDGCGDLNTLKETVKIFEKRML